MIARLPSFNLRLRLLTSYLVLILVTLGVIALALIVLIGNRAAPPQPTYERLAALTQGLNYIDAISDIATDPNRRFLQNQVHELLAVFARTRNVRTLHVLLTQDKPTVLYDSAQRFEAGDVIQLQGDNFRSKPLASILSGGSKQFFGRFDDPDGGEWLYGGVVFGHRRFFAQRVDHNDLWLLAEAQPTVSLQETLAVFSSALAPPLIQAGVAGFVFALLLAALISRNIARPLQRAANAATAVARGDYAARAPVSGPPEARALAESFNRMTAEVLATNSAQRDFLSNVSHDLKTPLTSIQGYAQAIIDDAAEDTGAAAQIIYEEAGRLNRMVVELTDLERLQTGRLSMASDSIDMAELSHGVAQSLLVVAERKQIRLETAIESVPLILGDGDRLAQVLTNLISNALKFTPAGGVVRLSVERGGAGAIVPIRDSGIGIPREELSRVFERFYQVDKARGPQRGTGLGLAIAREIVEAHGGRITVESRGRGKGAEFRVWLPSAKQLAIH